MCVFLGSRLEGNPGARLEEDLEASLEGNKGTRLEGDPSSGLAQILRSSLGEGRHPRRPLSRQGPSRERVHGPRHLEKETTLEAHLEEVLEVCQETDMGL